MTATDINRTRPQLSRRRRMFVLGICPMNLLMVGVDVTIVNVALPEIGRSFGASLSGLQWTVDAYTLVVASLLMLAGSTADRLGRRRVLQCGLVVFSVASVLCGLAPSLGVLFAARALQAVGGAMLSPVAMSIVRDTFGDPRERAQAIGVFASMFGISLALGPVLGGFLVSEISWRAVFLINVPVGLTALALSARYVPESRAPRPRRIDPLGQMLLVTALGTLVYALIEGGRAGFGALEAIVPLAVAPACLTALVVYELRRSDPLLEMRFFTSVPFAGAAVIALCLSVALGGFLFLTTLYLQGVRGLSPRDAGLCLLPVAAMVIIFAPLSGRLVARLGARPSLLFGGLAIGLSGLMLAGLDPETPLPLLLTSYAMFGLGFALVSPPIASTAIEGMPPSQAGVAAAVATTSRQVGIAVGVAALGAIAGTGTSFGSDGGPAFAHATHPAWLTVAALGLAVAVLGHLTTSQWARGTAERTAARLTAEA